MYEQMPSWVGPKKLIDYETSWDKGKNYEDLKT